VLVAILAVMAFPLWVFPHPRTNDAIGLADAEWPLLLLGVAGAAVAYAVFRGERGAIIRMGLGLLLVGSAITLVVALFAFGNLSNDRFAPLLFFPPVLAITGIAGIVVAVAAGVRYRQELILGAFTGLVMALGFAAWTLLRGARAWLEAPYGFDLLLLLLILGGAVVVLGTSPNVWAASEPVGRLIRGPRRTGDRRRSK
jgi:hypothetical protein